MTRGSNHDIKAINRIEPQGFSGHAIFRPRTAETASQGLGNRLIEPGEEVGGTAGEVACQERLGGMLRYYYRKAA
jgi:hypothetical protein